MKKESKNLHYFCLSFVASDGRSTTYGSRLVGFDDMKVTNPRIMSAKDALGISPDATITSISYLGFMSPNDFETLE